MSFFDELKRRNVIRVALGYLAGAWLLIQIVDTLSAFFELPPVAGRTLVLLLVIGIVPVLALTWTFEWTPDGVARDTGRREPGADVRQRQFDRVVIVLLVLAVGYFSVDKFILDPARDAAREREVATAARSEALLGSYEDRSIVVLPFVNMSGDAENEYFSDGITEELLNLLAKVRELRVISRSSSFVFKGQQIKATDVAEQLNVTYVLEGSVRRAGSMARITAQLIDARTDTHVWSDSYDREFDLTEVLKVQDEIATLVVEELKVSLLEHNVESVNELAYETVLQARYLLNLYDPENMALVGELIDRGLEADPDYAPLLWVKRRFLTLRSVHGLAPAEDIRPEQELIVERLRALDPDSPYWILGQASSEPDRRRRAGLVANYYHLAPTDPAVVENVARFARELGQFDAAVALGEYLVNRDPLCGRCYFRLGVTYLDAMRFAEAIEPLEKAALLGSGNLDPYNPMGYAYLSMGEPQQALEAFENSRYEDATSFGQMLAYYDLGDAEKFEKLLAPIWESGDWDDRALIAAWTGDADTAIENLETGYAEAPDALRRLFYDSGFMRIRDDPRWYDLMRRLGTAPEDIAAIEFDIELPELD